MSWRGVVIVAAFAVFLVGLVLVVVGGHPKAVTEALCGGLALFTAAHFEGG